MKSAAVVNYAPTKGAVEIREIEMPSIGEDDVLLEVANVGVCGSDLHQWTADHSWPVNYPVVLGHEFGGHIVETGGRVKGWNAGDRVVSETAAVIDTNNPMSRQGLYNLDPTRKGFGYGVNGAMTRYVKVPARCLHHVPGELGFEQACLTEPCCVAFNAVVENTRLKPGDRVIVLGPGTIGILCAAVAKLCGADVAVVGLETDIHRLNIAKQYGCDVIAGDASAWAKTTRRAWRRLRDRCGGNKHHIKNRAGTRAPQRAYYQSGLGPQPLGFSLDPLVQKNVTLQGSFSHNWPVWERVIALLASGRLDVRPIIGGVWPISGWHEAFEKMHNGEVVKSVLKPV